jgi:hypothetical protein
MSSRSVQTKGVGLPKKKTGIPVFFVGIDQSTIPPLPLPIRTSVGFLVIGKFQKRGKTIHPPLFSFHLKYQIIKSI